MAKVSVVILAGNDSHADMGRVLNGMALVKEAREAGDEAELVFDGAGVVWIPELSRPDHKLHKVFQAIRDDVAGACEFCCNAFEVKDQVREAGVPFLSEYEGHPSLRARLAEGYQIVTF